VADTYRWSPENPKIIGNLDKSVSNHLKCWIQQGSTTVVGIIGEGASKSLQANWDSPFEGDSAESSSASKIVGLGQSLTIDAGGTMTTITVLNSKQVWNGNQPTTLNVPMMFYALHDPLSEVVEPIKALERMISPQLEARNPIGDTDNLVPGRTPGTVVVTIGRHTMYSSCIIEGVDFPLDMPVDSNGHWLSANVDVQIQTHAMINQSQVNGIYK